MGFTCLRDIAETTGIPFDPDPSPDDPIALPRGGVRRRLRPPARRSATPCPGRADEAWPHFKGWRVNYESVAYALAAVLDAPPARWPGPRALFRAESLEPGRARSTASPMTATGGGGRPRLTLDPSGLAVSAGVVPRADHRVLTRPSPVELSEPGRGPGTDRAGWRARSTGRPGPGARGSGPRRPRRRSADRTRAITRSTRRRHVLGRSPRRAHRRRRGPSPGRWRPDLRGGQALVGAVVPLGQVGVDHGATAQPARSAGLPGPEQGAGQDGAEAKPASAGRRALACSPPRAAAGGRSGRCAGRSGSTRSRHGGPGRSVGPDLVIRTADHSEHGVRKPVAPRPGDEGRSGRSNPATGGMSRADQALKILSAL